MVASKIVSVVVITAVLVFTAVHCSPEVTGGLRRDRLRAGRAVLLVKPHSVSLPVLDVVKKVRQRKRFRNHKLGDRLYNVGSRLSENVNNIEHKVGRKVGGMLRKPDKKLFDIRKKLFGKMSGGIFYDRERLMLRKRLHDKEKKRTAGFGTELMKKKVLRLPTISSTFVGRKNDRKFHIDLPLIQKKKQLPDKTVLEKYKFGLLGGKFDRHDKFNISSKMTRPRFLRGRVFGNRLGVMNRLGLRNRTRLRFGGLRIGPTLKIGGARFRRFGGNIGGGLFRNRVDLNGVGRTVSAGINFLIGGNEHSDDVFKTTTHEAKKINFMNGRPRRLMNDIVKHEDCTRHNSQLIDRKNIGLSKIHKNGKLQVRRMPKRLRKRGGRRSDGKLNRLSERIDGKVDRKANRLRKVIDGKIGSINDKMTRKRSRGGCNAKIAGKRIGNKFDCKLSRKKMRGKSIDRMHRIDRPQKNLGVPRIFNGRFSKFRGIREGIKRHDGLNRIFRHKLKNHSTLNNYGISPVGDQAVMSKKIRYYVPYITTSMAS